MAERQRASREEIFERLRRLLGAEAEAVIAQAMVHLQAGESERGLVILIRFDESIGGTGLHSGEPNRKLPGVYRAISYVNMILHNDNPARFSRYLVDATCAHVEDVLKQIARSGLLGRIFADRLPMGRLLRERFQNRLPDVLYNDLLWLNDGLYIFAKHDYNIPEGADAENEPLDSHLFDLDEAIAAYLIARRLVVELEQMQAGRRQ